MKKIFLKRPYTIILSFLTVIAVILRIGQLAQNIEKESGFYINPSSFGRILSIVIMVLIFILGFVWLYIIKKHALLPFNLKFNFAPLLSERVVLAIVAVGFAANTFYEIFRLANPLPSLLLPQNTSIFALITTILSALSLIYFITISFLIDNVAIAGSLFSIVPVVWVVFRLLRDFISFTTVVYISKNLLDIIFLSALLITMFSFSRMLSDIDTPKGIKVFTVTAPITVCLGAVLSIPAIVGFIFGFECVGESDMFMHFVDLALSIFIFRAGMHIYKEN